MLIGGVGVQGDGALIITEVARIEGAEQAAALDGEALAVGRGAAPVAPDGAERQAVVMVDQHRAGRLERRLAQEPAADILEPIGGDGIDALGHGGQAEIGAVGDNGSKKGR